MLKVSNGTGVCLWFTGLSGAGKTTTARRAVERLTNEMRRVTLLDGDEVRAQTLVPLGFSKADRDTNVMRVAAMAKEIVERGEIAICALISPYRSSRDRAREIVGSDRFVEIFVDASLSLCERRDPKGLYARARRGELAGLTGLDAPYEPPASPDLVLAMADSSLEQNVDRVMDVLARRCSYR